MQLDHEKLDVYGHALDFMAQADAVANALPRGRAYLADQLRRASTSVVLNLAEGAGEFASADKARFYRIARRSAIECAAIYDIAARLRLAPPPKLEAGRTQLLRIVSMLIGLVRGLARAGQGQGQGHGHGGASALRATRS